MHWPPISCYTKLEIHAFCRSWETALTRQSPSFGWKASTSRRRIDVRTTSLNRQLKYVVYGRRSSKRRLFRLIWDGPINVVFLSDSHPIAQFDVDASADVLRNSLDQFYSINSISHLLICGFPALICAAQYCSSVICLNCLPLSSSSIHHQYHDGCFT